LMDVSKTYLDKKKLEVLIELLLKPEDFDFSEVSQETLGQLEGLIFLKTSTAGETRLTIKPNFYAHFFFIGKGETGFETIILEAREVEGRIELDVESSKEGEETLKKTVQIGPQRQVVRGKGEARGESIPIFDLMDISKTVMDEKKRVLQELLLKPEGYDFTEVSQETLNQLKGLVLRKIRPSNWPRVS